MDTTINSTAGSIPWLDNMFWRRSNDAFNTMSRNYFKAWIAMIPILTHGRLCAVNYRKGSCRSSDTFATMISIGYRVSVRRIKYPFSAWTIMIITRISSISPWNPMSCQRWLPLFVDIESISWSTSTTTPTELIDWINWCKCKRWTFFPIWILSVGISAIPKIPMISCRTLRWWPAHLRDTISRIIAITKSSDVTSSWTSIRSKPIASSWIKSSIAEWRPQIIITSYWPWMLYN